MTREYTQTTLMLTKPNAKKACWVVHNSVAHFIGHQIYPPYTFVGYRTLPETLEPEDGLAMCQYYKKVLRFNPR